jgi:membrane protease YdiL (CAAX protease family)
MDDLTQKPAIKRGWLRVLLIIIPFFFIGILFNGLGITTLALLSNRSIMEIFQNVSELSTSEILLMQAFGTLGTIFIIWIFMRFIDHKKMIDLGFSFSNKLKDILYGLIAGLVMIGLGSLFLYLSGNLSIQSIVFHPIALFQSVLLFILVAINEEIFVRGYILSNLMDSMNKYLALLLSALLFMALHLLNPNVSTIGMTNVFLAGILLGVSYIFTKNLGFPLAFHFSWNFFQGPIFGYEVSGTNTSTLLSHKLTGSEWLTGGEFGFEGSILASILCLIAITFFWLVYRKQNSLS